MVLKKKRKDGIVCTKKRKIAKLCADIGDDLLLLTVVYIAYRNRRQQTLKEYSGMLTVFVHISDTRMCSFMQLLESGNKEKMSRATTQPVREGTVLLLLIDNQSHC